MRKEIHRRAERQVDSALEAAVGHLVHTEGCSSRLPAWQAGKGTQAGHLGGTGQRREVAGVTRGNWDPGEQPRTPPYLSSGQARSFPERVQVPLPLPSGRVAACLQHPPRIPLVASLSSWPTAQT